MIRDKRKDQKYFDDYIVYQIDRIRKSEVKLVSCGEDELKSNRINQSLIKFKMDLLFAEFSYGLDKKQIMGFFDSTMSTAINIAKIDYESILNLLAFSILLDEEAESRKLITKHDDFIIADKLLNCFAEYIKTKKIVWNGNFVVPKVYDKLDKINVADHKDVVLLDYLDSWYSDRKETSWYESDKNNNDTYVGYWSFESAAIAKVFKLDESELIGNIYYPSFEIFDRN